MSAGSLPEPLRGPEFGTFAADEVAWLLKDLSSVELEAPTDEREAQMQSGGHYSESLPVEYRPPAEYLEIYRRLVETNSEAVAHRVGVLAERLHESRGPGMVLASLARAGTPIGVLVRDWLAFSHDYRPVHYSLSIIRGKGIDPVALAYLRAHHDPAGVVFVDGWTGKGAISKELTAALQADHQATPLGGRFDPDLAVVADPGGCTPMYGTRDDLMIPSACLNSTTCGLVSRTVHRDDLIGPDDFHGAKFYRELAGDDQTPGFLDAVRACFPAVHGAVLAEPASTAVDREPTWVGWRAVEALAARHGVSDINLVKPGIGETTRVLLRRVPWRIAVRDRDDPSIDHVLFLAAEREVEVVVEPDLPFACVGLIREQAHG